MGKWRPLKQFFMDELLWHDGLGHHDAPSLCCTLCESHYTPGLSPEGRVRLFKCRMCGEFLQCKACLLQRHQWTPLHIVEVGFCFDFVFHATS